MAVEFARIQGRQPVQLGQGERRQQQQRGSARQRLRNRFHEQDVLRPRDDEAAGPVVFIHEPLHVRQQLGRPLDLVENQRVAARQKPAGIRDGPGPHVRRLEGGVPVFGEHHPHERRLTGLAGPG